MVKIQPLEAPAPPTNLEFLDYYRYWYNSFMESASIDYVYSYYNDYLDEILEEFQSKELSNIIIEEYLNGDWRQGQEIFKIVITQRFYQISPSSTQA